MDSTTVKTMNLFHLVIFSLHLLLVCNQPIPSGLLYTQPATQTAVRGGNASFTCYISSNNNSRIMLAIAWERVNDNDQVYYVFPGPRHFFSSALTNTHTLTITNLSLDDVGEYYCVVYTLISNQTTEDYSNHSSLQVIEQATISITPYNIEGVAGKNLLINTVISGGSYFALQNWNGDLCFNKYSVLNRTAFVIYSLSRQDEGEYKACVITNLAPENTACTKFYITVTGFPFIFLEPLKTVRYGSSCTMVCNVTGQPTDDLQVTWNRLDKRPLTGEVTQLSQTELQLFIETVTDTIHLQCIASNSVGINSMVTTVNVERCIPDAPSITSVSCNNNAIHITWSAPHINNTPLTSFIIQVVQRVNKVVQRVSSNTTSWEVNGCEDSSTVTVTAENNCGTSVPAMSSIIYVNTVDKSDGFLANVGQWVILGMVVCFVLVTVAFAFTICISSRKMNQLKEQISLQGQT